MGFSSSKKDNAASVNQAHNVDSRCINGFFQPHNKGLRPQNTNPEAVGKLNLRRGFDIYCVRYSKKYDDSLTQEEKINISPWWWTAPVIGAGLGAGSVAIAIKCGAAAIIFGSNPVGIFIAAAALVGFIIGLLVLAIVKGSYNNTHYSYSSPTTTNRSAPARQPTIQNKRKQGPFYMLDEPLSFYGFDSARISP